MHVVDLNRVKPSGYSEWPHWRYGSLRFTHWVYFIVLCGCWNKLLCECWGLWSSVAKDCFLLGCATVSWVVKSTGFLSLWKSCYHFASKCQDPITHSCSINLVDKNHWHNFRHAPVGYCPTRLYKYESCSGYRWIVRPLANSLVYTWTLLREFYVTAFETLGCNSHIQRKCW